MGMNYWIWLAVLFNILTNAGFKYAALVVDNASKKYLIFSAALFFGLLGSVFLTESLKTIPLNIAAAVFFSCTIVGVLLMSHFLFKEELNWVNTLGILVIIAGVAMVNVKFN